MTDWNWPDDATPVVESARGPGHHEVAGAGS